MKVGLVNLYSKPKGAQYLRDALHLLDLDIEEYSIDSANFVSNIKSSRIKHWIFSGSDSDVQKPKSPQIPLELFDIPTKKFFLICYSMESLVFQLGFPVLRRANKAKGFIQLHDMLVWRNHYSYSPSNTIHLPIKALESYNGDLMTATYKNALLTQWHPERSPDGILFLLKWILH